ncbi:hypothetical protein BMW23_0369 [Bodo saltans virus]|uniref:Uncharacterized protein n=1 Tax=Bodo saltans virus TaxID=2024608 RepID=A0A2H4UU05_9VIRU|nr:hypothetical protein QJ851_gp0360 [Bodo saltans virus]ATZ80423.1 hypothetical protein BMW23_0369 [Bodo saltans virus]
MFFDKLLPKLRKNGYYLLSDDILKDTFVSIYIIYLHSKTFQLSILMLLVCIKKSYFISLIIQVILKNSF